MAFNRDGLEAFIDGGEGAAPPVLAGRNDVIKDIEDTARRAWKPDGAHGIAKATRIIQGAPGAGKSSILAELQCRSLRSKDGAGTPRVVDLSPEMVLDDLPGVLTVIAGAAGLDGGKWRSLLSGMSAGVSVGVATLAAQLGWSPGDAPRSLLGLKAKFPPGSWKAPVIIAIDEAQRFRGGPETTHARFLHGPHDGRTGLPLTLVLAGLGDTDARAGEMDLTRGRTIHGIGCLEPRDVPSLMTAFCLKFGMEPSGHEERLNALAAPCEAWPQHLHFALRALGSETLAVNGDLSRVDWDHAGRKAAGRRVRHYRSQQSPAMRNSAYLIARVMRDLGDRDTIIEVMSSIRGNRREEDGWDLPDGMDVRQFVNHLVHQGALQEDDEGNFSCPIPSFRAHLIDAGDAGARVDRSRIAP